MKPVRLCQRSSARQQDPGWTEARYDGLGELGTEREAPQDLERDAARSERSRARPSPEEAIEAGKIASVDQIARVARIDVEHLVAAGPHQDLGAAAPSRLLDDRRQHPLPHAQHRARRAL